MLLINEPILKHNIIMNDTSQKLLLPLAIKYFTTQHFSLHYIKFFLIFPTFQLVISFCNSTESMEHL